MRCADGACEDASMGISAACRGEQSGDAITMPTVTFQFNESVLTVSSREQLEASAECMRQAGDITIVVEGHADERGTQEYNLSLGERRAAAVLNHLRNLGIGTDRMRTVSKGENEPICFNNSESCHQKNRRVKFVQRRGN